MNSSPSSLARALETARRLGQRGGADLGLLGLRLWLAQEFLFAGWTKLGGGWTAPDWFRGLDFPPPVRWLPVDLNWTLAGLGEVGLALLLASGLATRLAAAGLLFITWVAVWSVHFDLGWAGWNQIDSEAGQGFKVPLMIALMLLALLTQGGGRWSLRAPAGLRRRAARWAGDADASPPSQSAPGAAAAR